MPAQHDPSDAQTSCGHAPCTCAPRTGDPYCSDACREAAKAGNPQGAPACPCPHPECHGHG